MRRTVIVGCLLLLGMSSITFIGIHLATAANGAVTLATRSSTATPAITTTIHVASATSDQPVCSRPAIEWAPLPSESPAAVLAAAECTAMFQSARHGGDGISEELGSGTIGQPTLIVPYTSGTLMDTVWVIPVVGPAGYPTAMLEFVYDRQNHRLRAGSFMAVGNYMFYASHRFPYLSATQAMASVWRARHVSLMADRSPELVYFYGSDHLAVITGKAESWIEGGDLAIDPMWRVPGADGRWYYVTPHDMQVRTAGDFPTMSGFPPIPQFMG
ncbi:MAG TPA: hypothetical protein VGF38_23900 [Ktedonobacterales bacterium]|jgi:hypothetical protein